MAIDFHILEDFVSDEGASASIEFVIIAPMLFWFVFSTFEIGWLMTQQTMLTRGMNLAVRDLRLGNHGEGTPEQMQNEIKGRVCFYARILRDCYEQIRLEVLDFSAGEGFADVACVDLHPENPIIPVVSFNPGARDGDPHTMIMRACVLVDLLLPGFGIAKNLSRDNTGRYQMFAMGAFANEPS